VWLHSYSFIGKISHHIKKRSGKKKITNRRFLRITYLVREKRRDSVARGVWEVGGATELPSLKKEKRQSKPVRSYMELPMPLT
tara:strand:- start:86 stop:334 length:249 start_codon:yes stop_codon:yes gene_type:complete